MNPNDPNANMPQGMRNMLVLLAVMAGLFVMFSMFQAPQQQASVNDCFAAPPAKTMIVTPPATRSTGPADGGTAAIPPAGYGGYDVSAAQAAQAQAATVCTMTTKELFTALENKDSRLQKLNMSGDTVVVTLTDGRRAGVFLKADQQGKIVDMVKGTNIDWTESPVDQSGNTLMGFLMSWGPMLLLVGVWIFMMNKMQGGGRGGAMGFGKSRAKMLTQANGRVTFADVAGVEEAKQDLQEVVEFLRNPGKFQRLGGKIPRGLLLVGPPGTGKTLIARAVAGEANVPFFTISGSDFVEMFVGVGASRVRDMFEQGKKNAPCIIFIDEIDAVGRARGAGLGGGNDEREQTLNQLLVEMDGFEANSGVILIAATNRPDVLDPALLRPGRFDRQVVVPNPDLLGREEILKVHVRKVPLADDVKLKVIARGTPGFSGADLANLVNEAALTAARNNHDKVTHADFEVSKDKIMMGAERKSLVMSDEELELTAYHEGGHAVVALVLREHTDPVHKATIIPRGRALGMVMQLPERDKVSMSYRQLCTRLAVLYGGRIAEELKFGEDNITTGAESDIDAATGLALKMVTRWGFSKKLGRLAYGENDRTVFLGQEVTRHKNISDSTAADIDAEKRELCETAEKEARRILTEHKEEWIAISKALLEFETLDGEQLLAIVKKIEDARAAKANGGTTVVDTGEPAAPSAEPLVDTILEHDAGIAAGDAQPKDAAPPTEDAPEAGKGRLPRGSVPSVGQSTS